VQTFYQVIAVDAAGNASDPTIASATRPVAAPAVPAAPTGVGATPVSDTAVTVSWNATPDATSYVLERRVAGAAAFEVVSGNVTATTFADNGLVASTAYEYRVRAQNTAGPSPYSAVVGATTDDTATPTPTPTPRQASVAGAAVDEPAGGTALLTFTISLDAPATQAVTVLYATADGTAAAGADYTAVSGSVVFNVGEQTKTVSVTLLADAVTEAAEMFTLNLTAGSSGVTLADAQAIGTINANSSGGTTLPVGGKQQATYAGSDGRPVKVKLAGPGTAAVTVLSDGVARVTTSGTTDKSTLTITGSTVVTDLLVSGSLKAITGKAVTLNGDVNVAGSLGKLTLGNVNGGGHAFVIGQGAPLAVVLGNVDGLSISSQSAIKSLKAGSWLDGTGGAMISAPSIGSMTIKGDFAADVETADLKKLSVSGGMAGSKIRTTVAIGSVTANTMLGTTLFAGVGSGITGLPASSADFASPSASIKSVTVKSKGVGAFSNTRIAAGDVGSVKLGSVTVANADDAFGVASMQTKSIAGTTPAGKLSLKKLADPSQSTAEDDFEVRVY
jgi:hypothetical protein